MKLKDPTVYKKIWLITLFLNLLSSECLHAQYTINKPKTDSLHYILKQENSPQKKIHILRELSDMHWQQPEEINYLHEILHLSTRIDSISVTYDAMVDLSRYYFNINNPDSFIYWVLKIDTLAQKRNELPDAIFMARNLVCIGYLQSGNYEQAMNEAIQQVNIAEKYHQEYGLMRANHNLGIIYQTINRDSDALVAYRKGLVWLKKNVNRPGFELQYLSDMIISSLKLNLFDESENLLKQYEALIIKLEKKYNTNGTIYPVIEHQWILNVYLTELYTRKNQLNKAKSYLDKAIYYGSLIPDKISNYSYYQAKALYYKKTGNNKQALEEINCALSLKPDPDILKMKVDVLRADGKNNEALATYDEVLKMNLSIDNDAFSRQMNQLRILNNINEQEKQKRELQYQKEEITIKQHQLVSFSSFSIILLVLLYIMWHFYKHTQQLKNELIRDKSSLIDSEKKLRIAKEEAEQANRMKTDFISNISHEIRTPLNAIVGFSDLLTNEVYEKNEKQEFASIINNNSEFLLSLVNNILDLSRLESDNSPFTIKPCDIVACCRKALSGIEKQIGKDVQLTFTTFINTFIINTDAYRIQQLLTNLLSNAAKFTKHGEINLSLTIDKMNRKIYLAVTDTGCGIPVKMQKRIFNNFEKLDDFAQGTGLGLPICQIIASRLNGSIYIDTDYTNGTRFIFLHPY